MKVGIRGEIPIPYIIALILGIAVVAIVLYWLLTQSGAFGGVMLEYSCKAKREDYCAEFKLRGAAPGGKTFAEFAQECKNFDWASSVGAASCGVTAAP
jgi:hypothetical protein